MYVLVKYLRIKRKGMFLLEKVKVLDNFDGGMSTAVVRHQYSVHQSTIKKNECKNFLCELLFTPFIERLKGPCLCVAGRWTCRL
jgi:hypothetical protein